MRETKGLSKQFGAISNVTGPSEVVANDTEMALFHSHKPLIVQFLDGKHLALRFGKEI